MSKVLQASGATGKVAIYDGPSDAPFTSPLSNLDKLYFHSDLDYVSGLNKQTGSLSIPGRTVALVPFRGGTWFEHVLFAHGRTGAPFTVGRVVNHDGVHLPLVGSVPLQVQDWSDGFGLGGPEGTWQMINLATDLTNVVLMEYVFNNSYTAGTNAFIAPITISWEVVVTDYIMATS
ncbi:MAG: hypothetical protein AB7E55_25300 [Pigmentiphaga sp.]